MKQPEETEFVAWDQFDGTPMVGKVLQPPIYRDRGRATVQRIDGTRCYVESDKLRPASNAEFDSAMAFFNHS